MGPTPLFANHQMSDQIKDNISLNVYMRKDDDDDDDAGLGDDDDDD